MKTTNRPLPVKGKAKILALLEDQRAELIDLMFQVELAHENVKEPGFTSLHDLFDKVWEDLGKYADLIAQRIGRLGETPREASEWMKEKGGSSYPPAAAGGQEQVTALARRLSSFGRQIRISKASAGEAGDRETAGLFEQIGQGLEKYLWLAEASRPSR